MRAKTANDPPSAQLNERIGAANGAIDDGLVENFGGTFELHNPADRGGYKRLGFTRDSSAVPVGNGNVASVAETAEPGNAMCHSKRDVMGRHEMLKGVDGADGASVLSVGSASIFAQKFTGSRNSPSAMRRSH